MRHSHSRPDRPDVLWVVLDSVRADALEPYGAPAGSSPTVGQLASRGVAVPYAYSTACWTLPSHASMFAGDLPRAMGLSRAPTGRAPGAAAVVAAQPRWLPEVLRNAGYHTAAVSCNGWVSPHTGFDRGFEEFLSIESRRQGALDRSSPRARIGRALEALIARRDDGAAEAERALRGLLGAPRNGPAFWFVNLLECHSPYMPPRSCNELSARERLLAAGEAGRYLTFDAILRTCLGRLEIPEGALERMRRLYAASVRYLDRWLGRILEELDQAGRLEDTLVIVSSDHGENLGEAGLITHAYTLDERVIHVPLVSVGPEPIGGDDPLSLAELPRLICRACLDDGPWHEDELPGAPVAQFDPVSSDPSDPFIKEKTDRWRLGPEVLARATSSLECSTDGRLKLVRKGGEELVYDLVTDPLELKPSEVRIPEEAMVRLRAALDHRANRAATEPGVGAFEEETAALEKRMRSLGYM